MLATLPPPPLTAGDSFFPSPGNWYQVGTRCTPLSNHTQKHGLLGVKCCGRPKEDTHRRELPACRLYSLISMPRPACGQSQENQGRSRKHQRAEVEGLTEPIAHLASTLPG